MKTHQTKLMEGAFTKESAKTLLVELLSYKIRYHQLKKFSDDERFGTDIDHSEKRMHELAQSRDELVAWLDSIDSSAVAIHCDIQIRSLD